MLFVFKFNKKFRLYIDYKKLNAITIKNKIFLLLIKEILNCLIDAKYFIKLNFKNTYYYIKIKKIINKKQRFVFDINYSNMR